VQCWVAWGSFASNVTILDWLLGLQVDNNVSDDLKLHEGEFEPHACAHLSEWFYQVRS